MKVIFDPRLRVTEKSKAQLSQRLPGIIDPKGVNVDTLLIAQGSKYISIRELGYDWYGKTIRGAVGWGDAYTPYVGAGERLLGRTHVLSMPGDRQFLKEMDVVTRITAESDGFYRHWRPCHAWEWRNMQKSGNWSLHPDGLEVHFMPSLRRPGRWPELQAHRKARTWFRNFIRSVEAFNDMNEAAYKVRHYSKVCGLQSPIPPAEVLSLTNFIADAINAAPRSPFAAGDKTQPIITMER
jgi:hypothetical protein